MEFKWRFRPLADFSAPLPFAQYTDRAFLCQCLTVSFFIPSSFSEADYRVGDGVK